VPLGGSRAGRGDGWLLPAGEETPFREFLAILEESPPAGVIAWSLDRFEMGCERARAAEALSDYLLALRALLDATSDAGEASLALRVAALCAEEGRRRTVQRRIEAAVALERFVMGGVGRPPEESPGDLVAEVEQHVRALLRDVICGYLDPNLKTLADDILLETLPDPTGEIAARDLRRGRAAEVGDGERAAEEEAENEAEPLEHEAGPLEPEAEPLEHQADVLVHEADTSEMEPVAAPQPAPHAPSPVRQPARSAPMQEPARPAPVQQRIEGVTQSADWGWGEPEDYSAPV
jgi:hypothetical protein